MSDEAHLTKDQLLAQLRAGWDSFNDYLATLTPEQLTGPTDATGWTVKDHIAHLARWEEGILSLLDGEPRHNSMGLDDETWDSDDIDRINEVIRQRDVDLSLDEVKQQFHDVHARLAARLDTLTDADLQRPYRHYQSDSDNDTPVIAYIVGNTFEHYDEHRPWIDAIVNSAKNSP